MIRYLEMPAYVSIVPAPKSTFTILSSSLPLTPTNVAAIGEYVTIRHSIVLPDGTTPSLTVVANVSLSYGVLSVVNGSIASIATNMAYGSVQIVKSDKNGDGYSDSIAFIFDSIVSSPAGSNNVVELDIVTLVPVSLLNAYNALLQVSGEFSFSNGTSIIKQSSGSVSFNVVTPELSWAVTQNVTSGDAGDYVEYSMTIQHSSTSTAAAYNVNVTSALVPYFNLISNSIYSSDATSILSSSVVTDGQQQIVVIPVIALGDVVRVKFVIVIDTSVRARSTITSSIKTTLTTAPSGGLHSYPLNYFYFVMLFYYFLTAHSDQAFDSGAEDGIDRSGGDMYGSPFYLASSADFSACYHILFFYYYI